MLATTIGANTVSNAALRLIGAALAAWCAIAVDAELLGRLVMARFYEPWIPTLGPLFAAHLPVFSIAAIAGFVFGLVLGSIFRPYPVRVAAYAGGLGAVILLFGEVSVGEIGVARLTSSVGLAIGFVGGGAVIGRFARA